MTTKLSTGIGGHQSHASGTVEWLTPPEIIAELGPFDLDPCAPIEQPYPTAAKTFTLIDNGLVQPWEGRVWLNPPYTNGEIEKWLQRMAEHNEGTALIFARTETDAFFRYVWDRATALRFMQGRPHFHVGEAFSEIKTRKTYLVGDRAKGNSGAPTVLCAFGTGDADVLAAANIAGKFVPLRIPRSVMVMAIEEEKSWREMLADYFAKRDGPVELDELYQHFAGHPKAAHNRNPNAKIRQKLQSGPYRRVAPAVWEKETTQ